MSKQKPTQSKADKLTQKKEHPFVTFLGAKWSNEKVEQTFVASINKPQKSTKNSGDEEAEKGE